MWYGVKPFSENAQLMLKVENHSNIDFPGRYVFRIDEWIQPGGCMDFDFGDESIKSKYITENLSLFYSQ